MDVNNEYNTSATVIVFPKAINGFVQFQPIYDIKMVNGSIDFSVLVYIEQKIMKPESYDLVILKKEGKEAHDCNIYVLEHIEIGKHEPEKGVFTEFLQAGKFNSLDRTKALVKKTLTYSYENAKMLGAGLYYIALINADTRNGVEVVNSWELNVQ